MSTRIRCFRLLSLLAGVAMLAFTSLASADPPARVARIGYMSGQVSFSPAGEDDWVQATLNRPLTTGDRLWADARSRAEVQVGGTVLRMNDDTDASILNLDDQIAQLQMTQGSLSMRVRRLDPGQTFEVDTPNLAFTVRQPGSYRIEVDPDHNATTIVVHNGQGEVYGEGAAYTIDLRQPYRFTGTGLRDYETIAMPAPDDFDRWSSDRDRRYDSSASVRYVSPDVVGYEDLDTYGAWRVDATYGNVWVPSQVAVGWAPYHDGHWAWVDPWGWTWVDDAPWGFAVSHYGRWASIGGTWCWVPGPLHARAYYAPALVAFVGGPNFQLSISSGVGVAWFPLGPREVYRPSYHVSRRYFENVNVSNTVVNTTVINNYYNNTNVTNVVYANRGVPGAVTAVPTNTFVHAQPVARSAVRVSQEQLVKAPVAVAPSIAPTERSVRGAAGQGSKPPAKALERAVIAHAAPPAEHAGFEAQKRQLESNPGKPLAEDARKELKSAPTVQRPPVKVIAQKEEAQPKAPPPAAAHNAGPGAPTQQPAPARPEQPAQAARPPDQHANVQEPRAPSPRGQPEDTKPNTTPPQVARPPAARPPEERAKVQEPRAPSPRPQPEDTKPNTTPPQVARPPAARPPEQRARPDQSEQRDEQRVQPPARPPAAAPQARVNPPREEAPHPPAAQPPQPARPAPNAERGQERKGANKPEEKKKQEPQREQ